jgi:hypothetical protein
MRNLVPYFTGLLVLLMLEIGTTTAEASTAAPQRAYWVAHDEIDYLDNLPPRTYSCDALYHKYRDVLLRLGARPDLTIYTYGCSGKKSAGAERPHVDLTYSVPAPVPPHFDSNSTLRGKYETIEISPGNPKVLSASDCALVNDMRQTVLSSFSRNIEVEGSLCAQAPHRSKPYSLLVQTMIPIESPMGQAHGSRS